MITPEYVWQRLMYNMEMDNGGPYESTPADFAQAKPAILAMMEDGYFGVDVEKDTILAAAGDQDEAAEYFSHPAYDDLNEVLTEVFERPII